MDLFREFLELATKITTVHPDTEVTVTIGRIDDDSEYDDADAEDDDDNDDADEDGDKKPVKKIPFQDLMKHIKNMLSNKEKPMKGVTGVKQTEERKQLNEFIKRAWNKLPLATIDLFNDYPNNYRLLDADYEVVMAEFATAIHRFLFGGMTSVTYERSKMKIKLLKVEGTEETTLVIYTSRFDTTHIIEVQKVVTTIHTDRANYSRRVERARQKGGNKKKSKKATKTGDHYHLLFQFFSILLTFY
jgi:hypothetical protein